jgi:hypothetical protein
LATVERDADTELRISWATYEGKPYVSIRIWNRSKQDGSWWPDPKKGCSARLRELPGIAEGIAAALDMAEREFEPRPSPRMPGKPPMPGRQPVPPEPDEFDEFTSAG